MKKQDNELPVYDDDDAIEFIIKHLAAASKSISEDTIEYVLDVIYDFYEKNGLIEENSTQEASIDEEAMFKFIQKAAKHDKITIADPEIELILEGEYQYGKSIGVYDEDEDDDAEFGEYAE
jgi:hypothetical protein